MKLQDLTNKNLGGLLNCGLNPKMVMSLFYDFQKYRMAICPFCNEVFSPLKDPNIKKAQYAGTFAAFIDHVYHCAVDTDRIMLTELINKIFNNIRYRPLPPYKEAERQARWAKYGREFCCEEWGRIQLHRRMRVFNRHYKCKWCGRVGFTGPAAMAMHTRACRENPYPSVSSRKYRIWRLREARALKKRNEHNLLKHLGREDIIYSADGISGEI